MGGYALFRFSKGLVEGNGETGAEQHDSFDGTENENTDDDRRDDHQLAEEAYAAKLEEYLSQFGAPDVRIAKNNVSAQGVCLAELVDFNGNSSEELLIVYYDKDAANPSNSDLNDATAYFAEAWSYVGEELKMVYKQPLQATNGGFALLNRIETEDGDSWLESEEYTDSHYFKLWSIGDDDSSVAHQFEIRDEYSADISFWLDGTEQAGAEDWPSKYAKSSTTYYLMDTGSTDDGHSDINDKGSYYSAFDCVDLAEETMRRLGVSNNASTPTVQEASQEVNEGAFAAFRDVIAKKIDRYGEPGKQDIGGTVYVDGLCLALLLDLNGDNLDELIVVGYDVESEGGGEVKGLYHEPGAYYGEVYQYRNGSAEWVFAFQPEYSDSGVAFVSVIERKLDGVPPFLLRLREDFLPDEFILYGMEGYKDKGFGSYDVYTHKTEQEYLDSKLGSYAIAEYHLFESELGSAVTGVVGKNGVAKAYSVDECLSITRDTMAKLGL